MPTGKATRLRASCERCRAQKVRCFPSSNPDRRAPCQRCVKLKAADSCIFRSRSSAQRSRKTRALPDTSSQDKVSESTAVSALPGTSRFALHSPCSGGCSAKASLADQSYSVTASQDTTQFGLDNPSSIVSVSTDFMPTDWNDGSQEWNFSETPWNESGFMDSFDHMISGDTLPMNVPSQALDESAAACTYSAPSLSCYPSPTTTNANANFSSSDTYLDDRSAILPDEAQEADSELLVTFTNLLAEMYHYEQQLTLVSAVSLSNYPIGDALYFSRRLYQILLPTSFSQHGGAMSILGMPTVLLILSCLVTLMRIYSVITGYLTASLSKRLKSHQQPNSLDNPSAYRGLRLAEVHQSCLCSSGELAKSAVSMLLRTLADIEDLLDLPSDVRATDMQGGRLVPALTPDSDNGLAVALEAPAGMKTKMFHSTVGIQGEKLRKEVAQLMGVFEKMTSRGEHAVCGASSVDTLV